MVYNSSASDSISNEVEFDTKFDVKAKMKQNLAMKRTKNCDKVIKNMSWQKDSISTIQASKGV